VKVRFGRFVLDGAARQLTNAGAPKHLSPKAFELLSMLVEQRPAVVEKAAIRQRLWPDVHVVDAGVTNLIAEIRGALSEDGADVDHVRTVHGVGYAFAGEAADVDAERAPEPRTTPFWIVWKDRPIVLAPGDNVIGRDAACAVWIDAGGVSRRHACVRIPAGGDGEITIEDLHSTNGTYVGGTRVTGRRPLDNGDRVRIGDATLTFRAAVGAGARTKRVRPPKGRR
jgi:DNA-binding winged helix-turn-helix (wHTH) protein